MTLRVTRFDGEYGALAAWTGDPVGELRAQIEEYHSEDRDTWLAWADDAVVGVLNPWRRPDGRHTLYFGPTRPDAYALLAEAVPGEVYATVPVADAALFEGLGFVAERREHRYLVPVSVVDAPVPAGIALVSAAELGLELRVWDGPRPVPRLGMVGVLPAYRRKGLALALVGAVFRALHARGVAEVACEVDVTNTGSNALFTGLGGRVVGGEVELRRPA